MYGAFTYGGGYYGEASADDGTPVSTLPGGGGFGAQMSDAFLKRYEPRYKPTLRKQKA